MCPGNGSDDGSVGGGRLATHISIRWTLIRNHNIEFRIFLLHELQSQVGMAVPRYRVLLGWATAQQLQEVAGQGTIQRRRWFRAKIRDHRKLPWNQPIPPYVANQEAEARSVPGLACLMHLHLV